MGHWGIEDEKNTVPRSGRSARNQGNDRRNDRKNLAKPSGFLLAVEEPVSETYVDSWWPRPPAFDERVVWA
jgi:hypothetical protein